MRCSSHLFLGIRKGEREGSVPQGLEGLLEQQAQVAPQGQRMQAAGPKRPSKSPVELVCGTPIHTLLVFTTTTRIALEWDTLRTKHCLEGHLHLQHMVITVAWLAAVIHQHIRARRGEGLVDTNMVGVQMEDLVDAP